jgi:hypothetical protein
MLSLLVIFVWGGVAICRFWIWWETNTGFIRGILRGVRYAKSLRVLFLHRRSPSWTTLVLYSRVVFIFNEPSKSAKLLQNMVYNTTQDLRPPPPPQPHTVCVYCTFTLGRGDGGGGQRECRGAIVHKYSSFVHGGNSSQNGSKIPTISACL